MLNKNMELVLRKSSVFQHVYLVSVGLYWNLTFDDFSVSPEWSYKVWVATLAKKKEKKKRKEKNGPLPPLPQNKTELENNINKKTKNKTKNKEPN